MLGNISFIGGIHGVGKSTICRNICQQTAFEYLSASDLIKWNEINTDVHNKKVINIPGTQDLLIDGLRRSTLVDKNYLLDGHYCLLDSYFKITPVPIETFQAMKLMSLHIVIGNVMEIKKQAGDKRRKKIRP